MNAAIFAVLVGGIGLFVLLAPIRTAFVTIVLANFLVPAALLVYPGVSSYLNVHRVLIVLFVGNLIIRIGRKQISPDVLRPTGLHLAFAAYAIVIFVVGIVFGNQAVPANIALYSWMFIIDQFVIFAVALAMMRMTDDRAWFARMLAGVAVVIAGIAIVEHFNRGSYASLWFNHTGQSGSPDNFGIEMRNAGVRVRAAAPFALSYAWIATGLLPIVVAWFSRARRRLMSLVFPGAVVLSVLWTYSRSAYIGILVVLGLLALGSRLERRVVMIVGAGALAAVFLLLSSNVVSQTFFGSSPEGSNDTRQQRLPAVLRDAATHPFIGLGLASGGLIYGRLGTDSSFLSSYEETGVIGVSMFVLLLCVAGFTVLPALRAPPGMDRVLGAAALAGVVSAVIANASYDAYSQASAFRSVWLVVALGASIAETVPRAARAQRVWRLRLRLLLPVAGCLAGTAVFAVTPRFGSATFRFDAIGPGTDAGTGYVPSFSGRTWLNTSCQLFDTLAISFPRTGVTCYDLQRGPGLGEARVQAPTAALAGERAAVMIRTVKRVDLGFSAYPVGTVDHARPTVARTAPVWLAILGFALALLPPIRGYRYRRRREPDAMSFELSTS